MKFICFVSLFSCDNCTDDVYFQITSLMRDSADWFGQKMTMLRQTRSDTSRCNKVVCDETLSDGK